MISLIQNVDTMIYPTPLKYFPAAAVVISLAACSSSSNSVAPLTSQAVDGYIVAADVECDGVASGITREAGTFTCPGGTSLSTISGGYDVGTDPDVTTGTVAFTGVLRAPASEPFVTPMTTLSVAVAQDGQSSDSVIDLSSYSAAQESLAQTLGVDLATLKENPVESLEAAKGNAKIHQVLAAFAPNITAYEEATLAFAKVIADNASTGGMTSLTANVAATMMAINEKLAQSNSGLALATVDLDQASSNVSAANVSIDNAESPSRVSAESQKALIEQAPVTIDRNDAMVMLANQAMTSVEQLTIDDFESPLQVDGLYKAQLFSGMTSVSYDNAVFKFNQNINSTQVTVGFEIKSVNAGDQRSLSFVSDEVVVSANKGSSESLTISMLSNASTFQVQGTDSEGVSTNAVVETDGETFNSDGDTLTINLEKINRQLSDLGFEDILSRSGDYSVTLVIDGLRINEQSGSETTEAKEFTVNPGADAVVGNGFRGYVSVIR
ncbi:MAG: hypothetical protein AB8B87_03085 [Granulosicoccus sp.]